MSTPASPLTLARIPFLGLAEEDVRFVEWSVARGAAVRRGQAIAVVETLKAAFEVEAEVDGVLLRLLVAEGERVPAQAAIAVVGPEGVAVSDGELSTLLSEGRENGAGIAESAQGDHRGERAETRATAPTAAPRPPDPPAATGAPAAPAARKRARELGVELGRVVGGGADGLVRVVDVEAYAREHAPGAGTESAGALERAFLAELRRDRDAFARLGSDLKVAIYRRMGAVIGDGTTLAPGAVIVAERLVLGAGAFVGEGTTIEAVELEAGVLLHLGARCRVRCRRLVFGDNAFLADDVEIGGGGAMDPEAELAIGSHGFVGEHVHLNPCRRVALGDEVVVSRGVSVMTHSFGGSALQGHPNRFAGVTVGDGAQLGIGAVLFPGVEVGAGAILLSGSSLVSSVPPGRLFGGVPAVDLKAAAVTLTPAEVSRVEKDGELTLEVHVDGRVHRLRFAERDDLPRAGGATPAEEIRVRTTWSREAWEALSDEPDVCGVDLAASAHAPAIRGPAGPLADSLREFLRKRGVRLRPRAWTYRGGWL